MLFWALLASGQITLRKVDGWRTLGSSNQTPHADLRESNVNRDGMGRHRLAMLRAKPDKFYSSRFCVARSTGFGGRLSSAVRYVITYCPLCGSVSEVDVEHTGATRPAIDIGRPGETSDPLYERVVSPTR
jgi:hypothetical protein